MKPASMRVAASDGVALRQKLGWRGGDQRRCDAVGATAELSLQRHGQVIVRGIGQGLKGWAMSDNDLPEKVRKVRLQVLLSGEIVEAIDDYRFAIRAPNRSEAVRQLLNVGQAASPPVGRSS